MFIYIYVFFRKNSPPPMAPAYAGLRPITKPNFELVKINLAIVSTDLGSKAKVEGNLARMCACFMPSPRTPDLFLGLSNLTISSRYVVNPNFLEGNDHRWKLKLRYQIM